MKARKLVTPYYLGITLCIGVTAKLYAQQAFISSTLLKTSYSGDVVAIDKTNYRDFSYQLDTRSYSPSLSMAPKDSSRTQRRLGRSLYKAVSEKKDLTKELTGAAILFGLKEFEMASPLLNGFHYVRKKTRFNFGKCSQFRLSTKRVKARSCFGDHAKLEFQANYKMDAFKLKFHWPL